LQKTAITNILITNEIFYKEKIDMITSYKSYFVLAISLLLLVVSDAMAGKLSIDPTAGTRYQSCYQPYNITMDTEGVSTLAVDTKLYLNSIFSLNPDTNYTTYISGEMDNFMYPFLTGTSTSWSKSGDQYLYINTTQNTNNSISGDSVDIVTLFLKPSLVTSWDLDFYMMPGINTDDSNISSGKNNSTQYSDLLTSTVTGHYSIDPYQFCVYRPYIDSGTYKQDTYISTDTWVQKISTTIPTQNDYTQTWDNERIDILQTTWRTTWTNTAVILTITGEAESSNADSGINILSTSILALEEIEGSGDVTTWRNIKRQFTITGNLYTGALYFDNIYGNSGYTYKSGSDLYVDSFYVDVFRLDTVMPSIITWYQTWTTVGHTTLVLSGNTSSWASNKTAGRHAGRSIMDDEYKIISFSGTNPVNQDCTNVGYACTTTGYAAYLSTTGYVWTTGNEFQLEHKIDFSNSFLWQIIFIDRAGNTGYFDADIDLDVEVKYGIIIYPKPNYENGSVPARVTSGIGSWMLLKVAIYQQVWGTGLDYEKYHADTNYNEGVIFDNLVYTGFVKTSGTWRAPFTGSFSSGYYDVLATSVKWLAVLMTWVSLNTNGWLIDFSTMWESGYVREGNITNMVPYNSPDTTEWFYHANYDPLPRTVSVGSSIAVQQWTNTVMQDDAIKIEDLAWLLSAMPKFDDIYYLNNSDKIAVYSGTFFTDKKDPGRVRLTKSEMQDPYEKENIMVFHAYDFDLDGNININDYTLLSKIFTEYNNSYGSDAISYKMPF